MRNVLQIVTDALDELGFPVPSSIVGTDSTGRQCLALLKASAKSLRELRIWPQQKATATITTVAGQTKYPLASDYFAALLQTQWDTSRKLRLVGPLSDSDMNTRQILGVATYLGYRLWAPDFTTGSIDCQLEVSPDPGDGIVLQYSYITHNMFVNSALTTKLEFPTADTDYCYFDDDLMTSDFKWRYLRAKKKDYQQEYQEAMGSIDTCLGRWTGTTIGSFNSPLYVPRYVRPPGSWTF